MKKANPCPGHKTQEEACEHYKEYLLDQATYHGPKKQEWPKNKCELDGCNNEATHMATCGGSHCWEFCASHCNRESVAKVLSVGWSVSSD